MERVTGIGWWDWAVGWRGGMAQVDLISTAWRAWIVEELREWLPAAGAEIAQTERVDAAIDRIVVRLVRESELEPAGR